MTTITVLPYVIHRDEKLYPNPEKFIPERFLDEDFKSKIGFGYIPFSAGYRNCIGKLLRVQFFGFLFQKICPI